MSRKPLIFCHLGALLAAAVLAWLAYSTPEQERQKGRILLEVKPREISRLLYQSDKKKVEAVPRQGGGFTLSVSETVSAPAAPAQGGQQQPAAEPQREPQNRSESYRASQEFERELERLFPLYVERELPQMSREELEKYGLRESSRRLSLQAGKNSVEFSLGSQTYGGASQYMMRLPDGPVFLVSTAIERTFDIRAPRYLERRLVEAGRTEIDAVLVSDGSGTKSRRLLHQKKESADVWVTDDNLQTVNTLAGTWMGKVLLLGAESYLSEAPRPEPEVKARLVFFRGGAADDELILATGKDEKGGDVFYGRSKFTGQWVRLAASSARDVVADLPAVLGGE